jgi:DNA-binding winged helix-turn-helix (wHTH) protein/Tfp pilus assembly protein PilF
VHSTIPADSVVTPSLARFGVFEADLRSGELRRSGVKVKIQDLPFKALTLLLSRPNEVLSREEFRQALWPDDVFVDFDRGITTAINRLRDALDDSASNPLFIETLDRRGYRWIAPTHVPDPPEETRFEPVPAAAAPENVVANARTLRWKYFLAVPALALLAMAAIFWVKRESARHSGRANVRMALPAYGSTRPANREAQEFYLKGRYYWEKRTPDSLSKAVDSFTQAIVHDPGYAPAYVGLADCYNLLREYTAMPASEAYPRALAASKKAVELDPQSSEAHASLAFASFYGMWDAATADREFRRAIELNPNNAIAHHWYATYLSSLRRYSEALAEIERAQALDPASKSVLADKGNILFNAGRQQEAIVLLQQMETTEPDFISPHRYLKFIYLLTADYSHYLAEAKKEAVLMHDSSALAIADATERAFAAGGGNSLLETLGAEQRKLYDRGLSSPFLLATTYSIQGNKPEALRYLKIAYDQRVDGVVEIESNHNFDNLANEPAFRKMLADAGLPPLN